MIPMRSPLTGSTITITDEGTYVLSGTLENGMLMVDAEDTDKVQIGLKQCQHPPMKPPPPSTCGRQTRYSSPLPRTRENSLSSGDSYVAIDDNNIDAAVFSKSDLTLNGSGTLTISSPAGHGVVSKDDLVCNQRHLYHYRRQPWDCPARTASALPMVPLPSSPARTASTEKIQMILPWALCTSQTAVSQYSRKAMGSAAAVSFRSITAVLAPTRRRQCQRARNTLPQSPLAGAVQPERRPQIVKPGTQPSAPPENQPGRPELRSGADVPTSVPSASVNSPSNRRCESLLIPPLPIQQIPARTQTSTKGLKASAQRRHDHRPHLRPGHCRSAPFIRNGKDISISGGTYTIATGDDGIQAHSAVTITDCDLTIADSYEGIEGLSIDISGGTISVKASDDGLNAAGGADSSGFGGRGGDAFAVTDGACITISGGTLTVDAR